MFIDTHCHLDYPDYFEKNQKTTKDIIEESKANGVKKLIVISANIESLNNTKNLAKDFENIYFSQGIHPHYTDYTQKNMDTIEKNIQDPKCVAIGEIGLDFYYTPFDKKKQIELFKIQLDIAAKYKKFVIIHSRDAEEEIYKIMTTYYKKIKGFVVHSYTGTQDTLSKFLDIGAFVSFNGMLTFKNAKNIVELAKFVPTNRIFLETDAPYLTPSPYRGKLNYPKYIPIIAQKLADIKQLPLNKLEQIIENNVLNNLI